LHRAIETVLPVVIANSAAIHTRRVLECGHITDREYMRELGLTFIAPPHVYSAGEIGCEFDLDYEINPVPLVEAAF
jgi:hypothetical protein